MEKFLCPTHPFRCIVTGPAEYAKCYFLTNSLSIVKNELERNLHQLTKSSSR